MEDLWDMKGKETRAIHPGTCEWMKQMTQVRGPKIMEEVKPYNMVWEDLLQWK